jgi:hypothetical protein
MRVDETLEAVLFALVEYFDEVLKKVVVILATKIDIDMGTTKCGVMRSGVLCRAITLCCGALLH